MLGTSVTRHGARARLSVLIYHRVWPQPDPIIQDEIDVDTFTRHMQILASGFNVLPLAEAIERLRNNTLPARSACITFDDGYANNAEVALPILERLSLPASFFIATRFLQGECMWNDIVIEALRNTRKEQLDLGEIELGTHSLKNGNERFQAMLKVLAQLKTLPDASRIDSVEYIVTMAEVEKPRGMMMTPDQVKSLASAGMEIGGHTVSHPILSRLPVDEARSEIQQGKIELERITGDEVRFFAYPNGRPGEDFGEREVEIVRDLGFHAALTTAAGVSTASTDPFMLHRFTPWDRTPNRFALRLFRNALMANNA